MQKKESDIETFCPASRQEWRAWLKENHDSKESVWLVQYKKQAQVPSISWTEAVDEALCFGWIDSIRKSIDKDKFLQFFSKRKPRSNWSKINKVKVAKLIEEGHLEKAGYTSIETAKGNGSWSILDEVEELIIPDDLKIEFERRPGSKEYFLSLSKSARKMMLQWIVLAKRQETRQNRIKELAEHAVSGVKPKQFR
ncbi:MAG TPA: YdeI/OmpD-associated family protein [Pedobacter sp.]|jgi:uncharacterized protein YdeI (YjbR/CyaY-like superfamily)